MLLDPPVDRAGAEGLGEPFGVQRVGIVDVDVPGERRGGVGVRNVLLNVVFREGVRALYAVAFALSAQGRDPVQAAVFESVLFFCKRSIFPRWI